MPSKKQLGFTLIELLVTVAIIAIIATIAVPSYQTMIEKSRLREVVQNVKSDIQLARSEAFKRSQNVFVDFITSGGYCYVAGESDDYVNDDCDCTDIDCVVIRTVASFDTVAISGNSGLGEFDFRRGTTSAFSVDLDTTNFSARVNINTGGSVELCNNPDSTKGGIYDTCSL